MGRDKNGNLNPEQYINEITTAAKEKIKNSHQSELIEKVFLSSLNFVISGESSYVESSNIKPLEEVKSFSETDLCNADNSIDYSKLIVFKLNGGLGTSMGLEKAKSLIPVHQDLSFLRIIKEQILKLRRKKGIEIPLVLMNSFYTEKDTLNIFEENFNAASALPLSLMQHKVPRILADSLMPLSFPEDREQEWCPPGHGDLYTVLEASGFLDRALSDGYEYLFVSNSDNLGATVNDALYRYLTSNNISFLMEVSERTVNDRKGGHLAKDLKGALLLREKAQVKVEDENDFQDISQHRYFNTNTLWIKLKSLKELLIAHNGFLPLPTIVNKKVLSSKNGKEEQVLQLETAMGTAISLFNEAEVVQIPRSRFLPVKTTDDLLRMRSDLFSLNSNIELQSSRFDLSIELDPNYYSVLSNFDNRFPFGPPSLINCSSLRVYGDVTFGSKVICKGDVTIKASKKAVISDNTILEGELIL